MTLRTFHVGGAVAGISSESNAIIARYDGIVQIDELRTIERTNSNDEQESIVIGRAAELHIIDKNTGITLTTQNVPYGSKLFITNGKEVLKGEMLCSWDSFNAVIISEVSGKISFENLQEGVTYREETDDQTGFSEKVVIESRDKQKNPVIRIMGEDKALISSYNLPVGAHIQVKDKDKVLAGDILVKIPRAVAKSSGDITGGGGLPRVTELFEARNPSNPAVVSEIDGEVSFGKVKRGNREILVTTKGGEQKKYMVPLSRQILVQENDYVRAGSPLSDGAITPADILAIKGPTKVQEYIVNEIQEVYRMQGVKINDKHFEVIVRQMMRKVEVVDPGDTRFLEGQIVDKWDFMNENDSIYGKKMITDSGDSALKPGQIVTVRKLRDENSVLKRRDARTITARDVVPATSYQILQGITRAALQTQSFFSAASFQETTKVLNEASIYGKVDYLDGLKENVLVGHQIPAGTGIRDYSKIVVGSMEDYEKLQGSKAYNVVEEVEVEVEA